MDDIVRIILHLLQLACFQVVAGAFKSSVDFHTRDFVILFIAAVRSMFSGVKGFFTGKQEAEAI